MLNSVDRKIRRSIASHTNTVEFISYFSWVLMMIKIDFYFGFGGFSAMVEAVDFFEVLSRLQNLKI